MRFLKAAAVVVLCFTARALAQTPGAPLRMGVYPFVEATKAVAMFSPLARYLGEETGRTVELEISESYAQHVERTGRDVYDLSYLGPSHYVRMTAGYGHKPILARLETKGASTYRGAVIVRRDSPLTSLGQLRGKRFAFGDRGSTMGYLVPRHMLWKAGVGLDTLGGYDFLTNQEDVALSVLAGFYDAGAVRQQVYETYESRGLRVLAWTDPLPEHLFTASSKLDEKTRQALTQALLSLAKTPGGADVLKGFQRSATGFLPGFDVDYQPFREILADIGPEGGER